MGFDVWCPLLFVGDVSFPLWGFDSKNLIGPVWSGKCLMLCGLMCGSGISSVWWGSRHHETCPWHGQFKKNFKSSGGEECVFSSNERGS